MDPEAPQDLDPEIERARQDLNNANAVRAAQVAEQARAAQETAARAQVAKQARAAQARAQAERQAANFAAQETADRARPRLTLNPTDADDVPIPDAVDVPTPDFGNRDRLRTTPELPEDEGESTKRRPGAQYTESVRQRDQAEYEKRTPGFSQGSNPTAADVEERNVRNAAKNSKKVEHDRRTARGSAQRARAAASLSQASAAHAADIEAELAATEETERATRESVDAARRRFEAETPAGVDLGDDSSNGKGLGLNKKT